MRKLITNFYAAKPITIFQRESMVHAGGILVKFDAAKHTDGLEFSVYRSSWSFV